MLQACDGSPKHKWQIIPSVFGLKFNTLLFISHSKMAALSHNSLCKETMGEPNLKGWTKKKKNKQKANQKKKNHKQSEGLKNKQHSGSYSPE